MQTLEIGLMAVTDNDRIVQILPNGSTHPEYCIHGVKLTDSCEACTDFCENPCVTKLSSSHGGSPKIFKS